MKRSHVELLQEKDVTGYTWNDLVTSGFIEYVDTEEEESSDDFHDHQFTRGANRRSRWTGFE